VLVAELTYANLRRTLQYARQEGQDGNVEQEEAYLTEADALARQFVDAQEEDERGAALDAVSKLYATA
jgi:hypothetical protein